MTRKHISFLFVCNSKNGIIKRYNWLRIRKKNFAYSLFAQSFVLYLGMLPCTHTHVPLQDLLAFVCKNERIFMFCKKLNTLSQMAKLRCDFNYEIKQSSTQQEVVLINDLKLLSSCVKKPFCCMIKYYFYNFLLTVF